MEFQGWLPLKEVWGQKLHRALWNNPRGADLNVSRSVQLTDLAGKGVSPMAGHSLFHRNAQCDTHLHETLAWVHPDSSELSSKMFREIQEYILSTMIKGARVRRSRLHILQNDHNDSDSTIPSYQKIDDSDILGLNLNPLWLYIGILFKNLIRKLLYTVLRSC